VLNSWKLATSGKVNNTPGTGNCRKDPAGDGTSPHAEEKARYHRPSARVKRNPWIRVIPQSRVVVKPLSKMTVLENVMVDAFARYRSKEEARRIALEDLRFTGLYPKRDMQARSLTPADRKRLELTRGLTTCQRLSWCTERIPVDPRQHR